MLNIAMAISPPPSWNLSNDFFSGLELHLLQRIMGYAGSVPQPSNASYSTVDHGSEFGSVFSGAVLTQPALRFFGRKPRGISIRFLRLSKAQNLAEMSVDGALGSSRMPCPRRLANIAREGNLLDPAMNSGLFEGFQGCGLSMR